MIEHDELEWIFIETATAIVMANLESDDIVLIKHSWRPVTKDTTAAGLMLFKSLFTKFPEYSKLFAQFGVLDIEQMANNSRLVRHATKVIDTVGFIVDNIGDDEKSSELNEALLSVVRSHLSRSIGLEAFRNLGIVLLDFICAINHSYLGNLNQAKCLSARKTLNKKTAVASSTPKLQSSNKYDDTGAVSQQPSSLDQDYKLLILNSNNNNNTNKINNINTSGFDDNNNTSGTTNSTIIARSNNKFGSADVDEDEEDFEDDDINHDAEFEKHELINDDNEQQQQQQQQHRFDTKAAVAAWTKLYGNILELVKSEQAALISATKQL